MYFIFRPLLLVVVAWTGGAVVLSPNTDEARTLQAFGAFIERFNHTYKPGSPEFQERLVIFSQSLKKVDKQNSKTKPMWTASLNLLSDRRREEVKGMFGWHGLRTAGTPGTILTEPLGISIDDLPKEASYNDLQMAQKSHIRAQACGDCWAAATAGQLEAHAELHLGAFRHFSEGEIAHCTENPHKCGGTGGCGGATSELALHNALLNGLWQEEDQSSACPARRRPLDSGGAPAPHEWGPGTRTWAPEAEAGPPELGPSEAPSMRFGMRAWERLPVNRMLPVMQALVERGPVAVAVSTDWHSYGDGIYDGCRRDAVIGHAVLLIGYGRQDTPHHGSVKYWHIQNSWGSSWGQDGKFKLLRTDEDETKCGIDHQPALGTGCEGGPKEVDVCGPCGIFYDTTVPHFQPIPAAAKKMAERRRAWHQLA